MTKEADKQLFICKSCGFIYDPEEGDPDGGLTPGTPFEAAPDSWLCPICEACKPNFAPYD